MSPTLSRIVSLASGWAGLGSTACASLSLPEPLRLRGPVVGDEEEPRNK